MIHWGPQRVALYNDAFALLIAGKHPAALRVLATARETMPFAVAFLREDDGPLVSGEQIRAGLESNRTIGTAIGILMANHHLPAASTFQLLVSASQHSNRKLRDIAADVISTGRLPLRRTLTDELLIRVTGTTVTPVAT